MSGRLAAATARAEEQQEQRQAAAQASEALTTVLPAIQRPPLTVPGIRSHGAARPKAGWERTGQQDHRAARPGRRPSRTGEHGARSADRCNGDELPAEPSPVAIVGTRSKPDRGRGPSIVVTEGDRAGAPDPPICAPVRSFGMAARTAPNSYSVALCPPGFANAPRRRPRCP